MPQLQSIDEVVEVLEPLDEAVSIPVGALMGEARWEMDQEQQIYVNIEMYDEVRRQLMRMMSTSGCVLQQTKIGLTLRNNRLSSKQQKNRKLVHTFEMHDCRHVGCWKDP